MKKKNAIIYMPITFILISAMSFTCSAFYFKNIVSLELIGSAEIAVSRLYFDDDKSLFANDVSLEKITQAKDSVEKLKDISNKQNLLSEINDILSLYNVKASMDEIYRDGILISQNQDIISKLNADLEYSQKYRSKIYISLKKNLIDINEQNDEINEIKDEINNLFNDENALREEYDLVLHRISNVKNPSIKESLLSSIKEAEKLIAEREIQGFSNINDIDSSIIVDLKYATEDNFTNKKVYDFQNAIARVGTCKKLAAANEELKALGYRIKVWDAYRPGYAQEDLWRAYPDPNFVPKSDPTCSNELGATLDVTLCDLNGNEIIMQSSFDDFSEKAYRNYKRSEEEEKYYKILNDAMTNAGFVGYFSEWWNYIDKDEDMYAPMQVDPRSY